jgi:hypothetical protein
MLPRQDRMTTQEERGPDLFRKACEFGLEGLVSKRRDHPYRGGASKHWLSRGRIRTTRPIEEEKCDERSHLPDRIDSCDCGYSFVLWLTIVTGMPKGRRLRKPTLANSGIFEGGMRHAVRLVGGAVSRPSVTAGAARFHGAAISLTVQQNG